MAADMHVITFDPARLPLAVVREYAGPEPEFDLTPGSSFFGAAKRRSEIAHMLYNSNGAVPWEEFEHPWSDAVWIAEVSWAKAGDNPANHRRWVPRTVEHVQDIYNRAGGVIQITPAFITQVMVGFSLRHDSHYEQRTNVGSARHPRWVRHRGMARARKVKRFLTEHMGEYTFVDSW